MQDSSSSRFKSAAEGTKGQPTVTMILPCSCRTETEGASVIDGRDMYTAVSVIKASSKIQYRSASVQLATWLNAYRMPLPEAELIMSDLKGTNG